MDDPVPPSRFPCRDGFFLGTDRRRCRGVSIRLVQTLQRTPLYDRHVALGARMVPFGGWDMPVEYSGITAEHMAVRTRAGLFDVSHMGEIEIAGKDALAAVQRITSNDA